MIFYFFVFLFITPLSFAMTWISFCHRLKTYHFFSILNSSEILEVDINELLRIEKK